VLDESSPDSHTVEIGLYRRLQWGVHGVAGFAAGLVLLDGQRAAEDVAQVGVEGRSSLPSLGVRRFAVVGRVEALVGFVPGGLGVGDGPAAWMVLADGLVVGAPLHRPIASFAPAIIGRGIDQPQ
jgi:hypothetical protein